MPRPPAIDLDRLSRVQSFVSEGALARFEPRLRAAAPAARTVEIMDLIGEDPWYGGGVTASQVAARLRELGEGAVEVHLNSPGGSMFEGIAIYNLLRDHPGDVTVKILGIAASAASIIAMAGDRIEIGDSAFLMIHNAWVVAVGNRNELRAAADVLDPFDRAVAGVYAARTRQPLAAIEAMMDAETYLDAEAALDSGFADARIAVAVAAEREAASARAQLAPREVEARLCRSGLSRSAARALIRELKGTPGAALAGTTRDAGADPRPTGDDLVLVRQLLETMTA